MVNMKIASLAFLGILVLSHAAKRRKYRVKRSITVEGTLYLNIPNDMLDPDNVIVMAKVGEHKPTESELPWKSCAKDKKCQYKVRNIAGNVGQKFAVGIHLNYVDNFMGMNIHDASDEILEEWTSATMEIKGEVTNQDIFYDIAGQRVTPLHPGHDMEKQIASLRTSAPPLSGTPISSPVKEPSKSENETGLDIDAVIYGTVEVILSADGLATAPTPAGVFIKLKLNGDEKRLETNVPWNQCTANRCPYAIQDVHGSIGQTYIVGVTDYHYGDSKRDRHNNVVWSKEIGVLTAALQVGEIKQDIKYDKVLSNVSLVSTLPVTTLHPGHDMEKQIDSPATSVPPSSGTSISSPVNEPSKNDNKLGLAVDVTVHGTVEVILPVQADGSVTDPKPTGIYVQLKLNDDGKRPGIVSRFLSHFKRLFVASGTEYETNVPWDQCIANKCPFAIKNVRGSVGQTYTLGVTDYYKGGSKKDRSNNAVWSKETGALKEGENKQDIKYDKVQPSVSLVRLSNDKESITYDTATPEVKLPSNLV